MFDSKARETTLQQACHSLWIIAGRFRSSEMRELVRSVADLIDDVSRDLMALRRENEALRDEKLALEQELAVHRSHVIDHRGPCGNGEVIDV